MAYTKKIVTGDRPAKTGSPRTGSRKPRAPRDIPVHDVPKGRRTSVKPSVPDIPKTGGDKTGTRPDVPTPDTRPTTPKPGMPEPAPTYRMLNKAFHTPGMQPGEMAARQRIAKNRGVSIKEAGAIGRRRTEKGLPVARTRPAGTGQKPEIPKRLPKRIPGRSNPGPGPFNPKGSR